MEENLIKGFYSWQSDLSTDTNNRAIATSIKKAFIKVEENINTVKLVFDEATRGKPGSPEIPNTIFSKIASCDIFICDISTINQSDTGNRKTPNPNVLIELGYAVALLGWERIVMLYNKKYGNFPDDLPFDLEKRRVTSFQIIDKADTNGKADLTNKLIEAVSVIIEAHPTKPTESKKISEEEIERAKDVEKLKDIFSCIHLETLDTFIQELPHKLINRIDYFWSTFSTKYEGSSFHIYDYYTANHIKRFKNAWEKTLSYNNHFSMSQYSEDPVYYITMDTFPSEKAEQDFYALQKDAVKFKKAFRALIHTMRNEYHRELDIDELSKSAFKKYLKFKDEISCN